MSENAIRSEYNKEKDVYFFQIKEDAPIVIRNVPGIFSVFYPNDIHVPKLSAHGPQVVKKAVVKLHVSLAELR